MKILLGRFFYSPLLLGFSLHSELDNLNSKEGVNMVEKAQETDTVNLENKSVVTSPVSPPQPANNNSGRVHTKKEQRSGNTLYQELSFQVRRISISSFICIWTFFC